jgi:hypothetical protein
VEYCERNLPEEEVMQASFPRDVPSMELPLSRRVRPVTTILLPAVRWKPPASANL